jgi:DNA-binding helix-hairpin-helix protein with protein kinase domain
LFITSVGQAASGSLYLDISAVEARIAEIPPLSTVPVPVDPREIPAKSEPLEPGLRRHRRFWTVALLISIAASIAVTVRFGTASAVLATYAALAIALIAARPSSRIKKIRRAAMREADAAFESLAERWRSIANMRDLEQQKAALQAKLATYRALPARYAAERARLEADKPRLQQRAHLDRFLIADAKIKGVGKKRKATLLSYGIETALDIDDRLAGTYLPKFGDSTRSALFGWVYQLKLAFRFDPSKPLDAAILNDLHARENRERADLERDLRGGPQALRAMAEQRALHRESLRPEIVRLSETAAKARADYRVFRRF